MLARIIITIILAAMAIGFLWFMAQVIYLGIKEFFKSHSSAIANSNHRKQRGRTAPNRNN